jgi:hypothetical protein
MQQRGLEPRSQRWQRRILTTILLLHGWARPDILTDVRGIAASGANIRTGDPLRTSRELVREMSSVVEIINSH